MKAEEHLLIVRIEDVANFEIHDAVLQVHDSSISYSTFSAFHYPSVREQRTCHEEVIGFFSIILLTHGKLRDQSPTSLISRLSESGKVFPEWLCHPENSFSVRGTLEMKGSKEMRKLREPLVVQFVLMHFVVDTAWGYADKACGLRLVAASVLKRAL